ncbi:MAG: DUF4281 domain-containing protein [Cyclobacteriaceae bacterium]|nr:DUF4281 domain-containing protein [Cyclobacteriaceae bacterium HetDA_MAG_MS6]
MTADFLFQIAQSLVLVGWAMILFTPRWKYTIWLSRRLLIPSLLGLAYVLLLIGHPVDWQSFNSLQDIRTLFSDDYVLLAGWIHYLAFDFLVGTWILRHSQQAEIPHLWVVIPIVLTLFAGPAGFIGYLLLHYQRTRSWPNLL